MYVTLELSLRCESTTRRKLLTKCKMDFHKLPYDTQHCDVYFALNEAQNDVVIVAKPGFELCGNHSWFA